jgi:hypothetical protein
LFVVEKSAELQSNRDNKISGIKGGEADVDNCIPGRCGAVLAEDAVCSSRGATDEEFVENGSARPKKVTFCSKVTYLNPFEARSKCVEGKGTPKFNNDNVTESTLQKWSNIGKEVLICNEMVTYVLKEEDTGIDPDWVEQHWKKILHEINQGNLSARNGVRQMFDYNRKLLINYVERVGFVSCNVEKFKMQDNDNVMWRMSMTEHILNTGLLFGFKNMTEALKVSWNG